MRISQDLPEDLVLEILILIRPRLAQLNTGELTEAKHLFDEEVWESFDRTVKRYFASIITILAELKRIPLKVHKGADGRKIFTPDRHNLFVKTEGKLETEDEKE